MKGFALEISAIAQKDLEHIYQYSLSEWGVHRASHYLSAIQSKLIELSDNPKMGQERPDLLTNTRIFFVGSHIIFYLITEQRLEILRVLHERQDQINYFEQ